MGSKVTPQQLVDALPVSETESRDEKRLLSYAREYLVNFDPVTGRPHDGQWAVLAQKETTTFLEWVQENEGAVRRQGQSDTLALSR